MGSLHKHTIHDGRRRAAWSCTRSRGARCVHAKRACEQVSRPAWPEASPTRGQHLRSHDEGAVAAGDGLGEAVWCVLLLPLSRCTTAHTRTRDQATSSTCTYSGRAWSSWPPRRWLSSCSTGAAPSIRTSRLSSWPANCAFPHTLLGPSTHSLPFSRSGRCGCEHMVRLYFLTSQPLRHLMLSVPVSGRVRALW